MLNNQQIKLVQMAVRAAGLRTKHFDARYRLLLRQYKQPSGDMVTSCKQLNAMQMEDLLAICESHGWRYPGKPADHFRKKAASRYTVASFAQQSAIKNLAFDIGWSLENLFDFITKQTKHKARYLDQLTPKHAYEVIEALKAIVSRKQGRCYKNLNEIREDFTKGATDAQNQTCQVETDT